MKAAQILREKINSPDHITTGIICTNHFWPGLIEIARTSGFDYLIIDMEHVSYDAQMVGESCAIGRREDFPILIRPPAAEFTPLRLCFDLGPCGLLVPYVESADTMQIIQDAVYMKPRGRRRPGGFGNLWVPDHQYETFRREVEDDVIILPQIESVNGLKNVDAIANHPLTTAMAVGPYDLSADLGVCWDPEAEVLQEALNTIRQTGRAAGKNMWMIGDGPSLVEQGYNFLCVTEPTYFLRNQFIQLNESTRNGADSPDTEKQDLAGA